MFLVFRLQLEKLKFYGITLVSPVARDIQAISYRSKYFFHVKSSDDSITGILLGDLSELIKELQT